MRKNSSTKSENKKSNKEVTQMSEFIDLGEPFFLIAIAFAILYGWLCFSIFGVDLKGKNLAWKLSQRWFNATGAFIGWFALYYIWETDICNFKIEHFVALIIAFLGITGNLPYVARFSRILKGP